MPTLSELLCAPTSPDHATDHATDHAKWFRAIALALLRSTLWVGKRAHTITELEFYYSDPASDHVDPFAHCDPVQRGCATWYLHRQGKTFRGGTYKGIDLTFGPAHAYGGILIRSLRDPDGALICGSSLCVDHLLVQTGMGSVAALAQAFGEREVDDDDMPVRIEADDTTATELEHYATARVGLTLRRVDAHPSMLDYIARRYRYLTTPREIGKGRAQLVVALHEAGHDVAAIAGLVGSPKRSIERWIAAYERGRTWADTRALWGKTLDSDDLCQLLGALART